MIHKYCTSQIDKYTIVNTFIFKIIGYDRYVIYEYLKFYNNFYKHNK